MFHFSLHHKPFNLTFFLLLQSARTLTYGRVMISLLEVDDETDHLFFLDETDTQTKSKE